MKRLTAMLLAVCCLFALTACGAQTDPGPMDEELQSDAPDASPSASPSAEPEAAAPAVEDEDMQLVWTIGDSVCPGFDTVMDRGTYTLAGVECRLFYFVKESRFAGEACVAPDKTVYIDLDGTLNWQLAVQAEDGSYTLETATALLPPETTEEPTDEVIDEEDDDTAEETPEPTPEATPAPTVYGDYVWPVDGYNIITYAFGEGGGHSGMDISGGDIAGAPVLAIADGIVNYIGYDEEGYGDFVTISHENDDLTFSLYGQLESIIVAEGESVSAGEVIGYVGMSGSATGYHLHLGAYETWDWDSYFDPLILFDGVDVTYWE
ncbi:MAG: M23 family metallopeptidase [Oscillospiraceae bacterium]|nr:M23 family metallopeptidase [Oscillospiraceae bacterium]